VDYICGFEVLMALCFGIILGGFATSCHIFRKRPKCTRVVGPDFEHFCVFNKGHEGQCGYFVNEEDEE